MTYYGARELVDSFRTVRSNTITMAEEIPAEKYDVRMTPDTRSVAELLSHIAVTTFRRHRAHAVDHLTTMVGVDFPALVRQQQEEEKKLQTKPQILEALRKSGDLWAAYLESVSEQTLAERITYPEGMTPPSKSRFELLLALKEHEMHHRAQLAMLQRLIGVVPHLTRRFEEMMAKTAGAGAR